MNAWVFAMWAALAFGSMKPAARVPAGREDIQSAEMEALIEDARSTLVPKLESLGLPEGWWHCPADAFFVFRLCRSSRGADVTGISAVNVVVLPMARPKTQALRARLESGKVKQGSVLHGLKVQQVSKTGGVFFLQLADVKSNPVRQIWGYGTAFAFGIDESGPEAIPEPYRSQLVQKLREAAGLGDHGK